MTERSLSPMTYVVIDLVLVALTILTVALSFIEEPAIGHLLGGLVIAVIKAALVILFFMHALRSRTNEGGHRGYDFLVRGRHARADLQ